MQIRPNQTVLEGFIRGVRPETDGWGVEVVMDVLSNVSPQGTDDFIRSGPGDQVTAFYARPEPPGIGEKVRAQLTLHGGPGGERAVIQSFERLIDNS